MPHAEPESAYAALRARYSASLITKHRELAQVWARLQHGATPAEQGEALGAQLHRLCGSATAYGYPAVGQSACAAERCLREFGHADVAFARAIEHLLAALAEVVAAVTADDAATLDLHVVLLAAPGTPPDWLRPALQAQGCRVERLASARDLPTLLASMVCHAVVFDARLPQPLIASMVQGVRDTPSPLTPLLVCYCGEAPSGFHEAALAAGCDAALSDGDGVERLLALVRTAHGRADDTQDGTA